MPVSSTISSSPATRVSGCLRLQWVSTAWGNHNLCYASWVSSGSCSCCPWVSALRRGRRVQDGSIFVKSADEQGAAVPGATVTITGPVLPTAVTGVTDSSGNYRSPLIPVGTYTVKIALQGFQTISRENVVVLQSQTVTLEFTMKVSTVNEEVTVKGESPVVDTKSTNVNVNLDKKLLENTPGGKDIWNILEYKVPGLIFDSPDVGGNQAGLQRGIHGARHAELAERPDAQRRRTSATRRRIGFSMNYYDANSFENIQVSTGSQDISMGTLWRRSSTW